MHCFLFKFTLSLNSVLLFWKLLVFEFLPGILETLLCSVSAPQVRIVPLRASAANVVCRNVDVLGAKKCSPQSYFIIVLASY
jgi:hypothetical protein